MMENIWRLEPLIQSIKAMKMPCPKPAFAVSHAFLSFSSAMSLDLLSLARSVSASSFNTPMPGRRAPLVLTASPSIAHR